ncbi:MAG: hypothetical protein P4L33_03270 [Capsulimonadaceae bacterium]|nr:hypothetical protein [Capsulimonadaceae bacterium]
MTHLFEELPWWLGGVAAIIVGGVSAAGGCDVWDCLMRSGLAYAIFWVIGIPLGKFFRETAVSPKPESKASDAEELPPSEDSFDEEDPGEAHISGDIEE